MQQTGGRHTREEEMQRTDKLRGNAAVWEEGGRRLGMLRWNMLGY